MRRRNPLWVEADILAEKCGATMSVCHDANGIEITVDAPEGYKWNETDSHQLVHTLYGRPITREERRQLWLFLIEDIRAGVIRCLCQACDGA